LARKTQNHPAADQRRGLLVGYARVSTTDQNPDSQIDALIKEGVEEKHIYLDRVSGKNTNRPAFKECRAFLRPGDTLVVLRLDRLGRRTVDVLNFLHELKDNGINFKSIKDNIDTSTAIGLAITTIISAIAEMERSLIVERTKEGIEAMKLRGMKSGRKSKLSSSQVDQLLLLSERMVPISEIMKTFKISRRTYYRYLDAGKKANEERKAKDAG
jgi:Site-specific recombinases, DNA invertase Pin homologs